MSELAFEPARLRLARELKRWTQTQLAGHVSVTGAALSQFESGAARPSPDTLSQLSRALEVPTAFFALPVLDTHEGFFRATRRTSVTDRRRARALAHIAHDLAISPTGDQVLPALSLPQTPVTDLDTPREQIEKIAAAVRRAWGLRPGPVDNVVGLLESHGILVLRLPLDSADVDAFSLPFHDHPVVVLGCDKNDRARSRFDAAHELGHLVMHGEQLWGIKEVEQQAHQFAAAFLMPEQDIRARLPHRGDWSVLFDLKREWQVSLAALLMRARTLGRMTESSYLTAVKALSARGWRRQEPVPIGPPEQPRLLERIMLGSNSDRPCDALPTHIVDALAAANIA